MAAAWVRRKVLLKLAYFSATMEAIVAQMMMLVGRRMQANAAAARDSKSFGCSFMICVPTSEAIEPAIRRGRLFLTESLSSRKSRSLRMLAIALDPIHLYLATTYSTEAPSSLTFSASPAEPSFWRSHCHGHRSSAAIVKVVSIEFENVRGELCHCQGLHTVKTS